MRIILALVFIAAVIILFAMIPPGYAILIAVSAGILALLKVFIK